MIQITIQTNDSSSSVEINTGNTHLHNRGSNTDNVENVDNAKNWLMMIELVIFGTRKSPIQFGEAYTHWKKLWKWGGYVVYVMDFEQTLYMRYIYFVYGHCIWTLVYFGLCGIYDFRRGVSCELRLA